MWNLELVDQSTETNCFAACLATLLQISIDDVPVSADGSTWDLNATQEWIHDKFRMQIIEMVLDHDILQLYPIAHEVPCIFTGPSPRDPDGRQHAVVGKLAMNGDAIEFLVVHDPHKSRAGLAGQAKLMTLLVDTVPRFGGDVCWRSQASGRPAVDKGFVRSLLLRYGSAICLAKVFGNGEIRIDNPDHMTDEIFKSGLRFEYWAWL